MKFSICLLFTIHSSFCGNGIDDSLKCLKQKPPTHVPEIFASGIISLTDEYEFGSVFNESGTEFFYVVAIHGKEEIRYTQLIGEEWSAPETILTHTEYGYNDPFLTPDEQQLYFISKRVADGQGASENHDIWYVERMNTGWSEPINAGPNINSAANEYYISFTNDGSMYFSSNKIEDNFDIYKSPYEDGKFQEAVLVLLLIRALMKPMCSLPQTNPTLSFVGNDDPAWAEVICTLVLKTPMVLGQSL